MIEPLMHPSFFVLVHKISNPIEFSCTITHFLQILRDGSAVFGAAPLDVDKAGVPAAHPLRAFYAVHNGLGMLLSAKAHEPISH